MNLHKKLSEWQAQGLLDAATRERIEAYEQQHRQPVWLYTVGGLGALAIAIGLVSVVAANWESIGRAAKLSVDLLLGGLLAAALYVAVRRDKLWQTDLLAGIYYGFTLASIALLGQVYQLGSPTFHGLLAWSASTLPLLYFVRGRYVALLWLIGLLWTELASAMALFEYLDERGWTDTREQSLAAALGAATLVVLLAFARWPWLVRERPHVSAAWSGALWACLVTLGLGLAFLFYESVHTVRFEWTLALSGVLVLGLALALPRLYADVPARARHGMRALLASVWLTLALGFAFPHPEVPAVGASLQVAVLAVASFTVLSLGRTGTFNVLTALIGVRLLVMYFEVFGSMLGTGLGLVTGGVLTVLLAWLWKKKAASLAARFRTGGTRAS